VVVVVVVVGRNEPVMNRSDQCSGRAAFLATTTTHLAARVEAALLELHLPGLGGYQRRRRSTSSSRSIRGCWCRRRRRRRRRLELQQARLRANHHGW
jgi:hypothetical protein